MEALEGCKWRQIPAFGDWNLWEGGMPVVTRYFEPGTFFFTAHAGGQEDEVADLFKAPPLASGPYAYKKCVVRVKGAGAEDHAAPARKGGGKKKKMQQQENERRKRMPRSTAATAAVDEDLYKISPKVVCKVQKKKMLRNLFGECMGLNCIP